MSEADLIRGYAEALVAVAEAEGDPARVEDELFAFGKAVEANDGLREALDLYRQLRRGELTKQTIR